jgi:hypothetical protein
MSRYHTHFPNADVLLFEPRRDEYRLFFGSIFSFDSRREVCEIGYRATRRDLWRRRAALEPVLRRHGLRLRLDLLKDDDRSVWEGIGLGRDGPGGVVGERLSKALARLERIQSAEGRPRPRRPVPAPG